RMTWQVQADRTYAGVISGSGDLQKGGANQYRMLFLTGANTYTGGTVVPNSNSGFNYAGGISIGSGGATGSISDTGGIQNNFPSGQVGNGSGSGLNGFAVGVPLPESIQFNRSNASSYN